jgi:hypothetical protein
MAKLSPTTRRALINAALIFAFMVGLACVIDPLQALPIAAITIIVLSAEFKL